MRLSDKNEVSTLAETEVPGMYWDADTKTNIGSFTDVSVGPYSGNIGNVMREILQQGDLQNLEAFDKRFPNYGEEARGVIGEHFSPEGVFSCLSRADVEGAEYLLDRYNLRELYTKDFLGENLKRGVKNGLAFASSQGPAGIPLIEKLEEFSGDDLLRNTRHSVIAKGLARYASSEGVSLGDIKQSLEGTKLPLRYRREVVAKTLAKLFAQGVLPDSD